MDQTLVEDFDTELDALRDQSNMIQHWVIDVMNASEDEELHDLVNNLGDALDDVKNQIQAIRNWLT